jgi:hypothetical protein
VGKALVRVHVTLVEYFSTDTAFDDFRHWNHPPIVPWPNSFGPCAFWFSEMDGKAAPIRCARKAFCYWRTGVKRGRVVETEVRGMPLRKFADSEAQSSPPNAKYEESAAPEQLAKRKEHVWRREGPDGALRSSCSQPTDSEQDLIAASIRCFLLQFPVPRRKPGAGTRLLSQECA